MGNTTLRNSRKIFTGSGGDASLPDRVLTLENNEYKVTYYEIISGASGSLTLPTGATINAGEFGLSGNCILSKIDGSNKPTFESPKMAGGVVVTSSLNVSTGAWVASGVYTDASVALIYSIKIKAINYSNLTYANIIETVELTDFPISQTITNGDTTHSPSGDVVFDALALKENAFSKNTGFNLPLGTTAGTVMEGFALSFVTPEMYGAVGDGVTDDTTAIQNAINSGKMVVLGAKNYRVNSSITLSGNKTIIGSGALSVISTTSNISVFSITGSNNTISNLTILGNNNGASQNGVSAVGNVGFTLYYLNNIVSECLFKNLGGYGIYATNIIGSSSGNKHEGTYTINSCIFESCNYGINFAVRGEYNNVNNCAISSCTTGISITGGNNSVNGGKITDCTTGLELLTGANDGHSVASAVMINHNTKNISSSSLASGYLFEGCMIYAGNLSLLNSAGLYFSSCFFGGSMTITSTSNTNTRFTNCNFVSSFTLTLTGTQPLFNNCKFSSQPSNVLNTGGDKVDISSTSTVVGWSSTTTKLIKYWASGKSLFISFDIEGPSNSASASITIPFGQSGATNTAKVTSIYAVNNGAAIATGGAAQINGVSTTVNFFTSMGLATWTASGTKRILGMIVIELEN